MGYYIGEIVKLRKKFFRNCDNKEYTDALKIGMSIIKLYKDNDAAKGLEYANDLNNLAIVYDNLMSHEKAVKIYREVAEIREDEDCDDSLSYADTISNMAVAYCISI